MGDGSVRRLDILCVCCVGIIYMPCEYDSTRNVTVQLVRTVIGAGKGTKAGDETRYLRRLLWEVDLA